MTPKSVDGAGDLPETLYVFVNQAGARTRHNFERTGRFVSGGFSAAFPDLVPVGTIALFGPGNSAPQGVALQQAFIDGSLDYLQFTPNPDYFGWLSPFADAVVVNYRLEYDAEVARRHYVPLAPSRLSAIYAFGDFETCERVQAAYGWPLGEVREFRLVPHEHNRWTRVNMEIVSVMRYAYPRGMWSLEDLDKIWRSYWNGEAEFRIEVPIDGVIFEERVAGCLWEYLLEGVLEAV